MRFEGYAIIIGAMKSGTTTLHHILNQHPEIVGGVRKELNFFRRGVQVSYLPDTRVAGVMLKQPLAAAR